MVQGRHQLQGMRERQHKKGGKGSLNIYLVLIDHYPETIKHDCADCNAQKKSLRENLERPYSKVQKEVSKKRNARPPIVEIHTVSL
jgi:hypothetical protein